MPKSFFKNIELSIPEGVYEPREDSWMLAQELERLLELEKAAYPSKTLKVLDMGTGSGIQAIVAAKKGCGVMAADINPKAVDAAKLNAQSNKVKIRVAVSDLFQNILERFDLIIFNPPYLPENDKGVPDAEMWQNSGVIKSFLKAAPKFLKNGGKILIVYSSLTRDMKNVIRENSYAANVLSTQKVSWEELIVVELTLL